MGGGAIAGGGGLIGARIGSVLLALERHPRRWLIGIFLVALTLRVAVVAMFPETIVDLGNTEKNDEFAWVFLTRGVFGHIGWFGLRAYEPSAYTRPAYAWFLIALYGVFGRSALSIGLAQATLSATNVLLVYLIGRQLTGRAQSLLAAAAIAVYPYPVWHDVHAVRTCLDATFSLASVLFLLRLFSTRRLIYGAAAGVTLVAAAQTTNLILGLVPLTLFWFWLEWRSLRRALVAVGLTALCALLTLAPWTARNLVILGKAVPFSSDNGTAFYKNNNDYVLSVLEGNMGPDHVGQAQEVATAIEALAPLPEVEADSILFQRGLQWIVTHPQAKLKLMLLNAINYWDPTRVRPFSDTFFEGNGSVARLKEVAYALSAGPVVVLGLIGLARRVQRDRRAWLVLTIFLYNTALFSISYASTRYRVPFDGLLAIYAADLVLGVLAWRLAHSKADPERQPILRPQAKGSVA